MFLIVFNPFHASGLFVYPLKTENQKFSDKFRGNRSYLIRLILEAKFGDEHQFNQVKISVKRGIRKIIYSFKKIFCKTLNIYSRKILGKHCAMYYNFSAIPRTHKWNTLSEP